MPRSAGDRRAAERVFAGAARRNLRPRRHRSRHRPFPDIIAADDAAIDFLSVEIDGAQHKVTVWYTTDLSTAEAFALNVEELDRLGTIDSQSAQDGDISSTPYDATTSLAHRVRIRSNNDDDDDGPATSVGIVVVMLGQAQAELVRYAEWHDFETPLDVTTEVRSLSMSIDGSTTRS